MVFAEIPSVWPRFCIASGALDAIRNPTAPNKTPAAPSATRILPCAAPGFCTKPGFSLSSACTTEIVMAPSINAFTANKLSDVNTSGRGIRTPEISNSESAIDPLTSTDRKPPAKIAVRRRVAPQMWKGQYPTSTPATAMLNTFAPKASTPPS